jgi:hypothetical protein
MTRPALALAFLGLLACKNEALERARTLRDLDRDAACELALDYFRNVEKVRDSNIQYTCTGKLTTGDGVARLEGYSRRYKDSPVENVTMCFGHGFRWIALWEGTASQPCPAEAPSREAPRMKGETAAQALEDRLRGDVAERERKRRVESQHAAFQKMMGALRTHEHREALCSDTILATECSGYAGVRYADLDLLADGVMNADWGFLNHSYVHENNEALGGPYALVVTARPGGKHAPEANQAGRFDGWAMLVRPETGEVACETELQLTQSAGLDALIPEAREALLALDKEKGDAEMQRAMWESFGRSRTQKNMDREAEEALDIVKRQQADEEKHRTAELNPAAVYRWDLARSYEAKLPKTLAYLTGGKCTVAKE